jgi:hypothetical protein
MKGQRPKRRCAYCGSEAATTVDHVVPRSLYPASKSASRIQRITVPACKSCNNGWSDDEAHFRSVILLCGEKNPVVHELWEGKTRRALAEADGRKRALDLAIQLVPIKTPDGDRHMIYPAKDERVTRVVRKIVRGLCHRHNLTSPVLDAQVLVDVHRFAIPPKFLDEMTRGNTDEDVLKYQFGLIEDRDIHSGWLLTFYGRTAFLCIVFKSVEARDWPLDERGGEPNAA